MDRLELSSNGGIVTVWFKSGWSRRINIEADSRGGIMLDVLRKAMY